MIKFSPDYHVARAVAWIMLGVIGGAIAAYFIWDEVPDRWVVAGALIIVAFGLFVVYRSKDAGAIP